ncbi:MAG: hypothetical protein MJ214_05595 [Bacilli bacterium]|nr:hypothetical protein [Bacilli bacterium]
MSYRKIQLQEQEEKTAQTLFVQRNLSKEGSVYYSIILCDDNLPKGTKGKYTTLGYTKTIINSKEYNALQKALKMVAEQEELKENVD